jgi:hypothetical protein
VLSVTPDLISVMFRPVVVSKPEAGHGLRGARDSRARVADDEDIGPPARVLPLLRAVRHALDVHRAGAAGRRGAA